MSWLDVPGFGARDPFGPHTLPYGIVDGVVAVRVGDLALPLPGLVGPRCEPLVRTSALNPLLSAGRPAWTELRERVRTLVDAPSAPAGARPVDPGSPPLPFTVADYVDFYSSYHHASNASAILRPAAPEVPPNWEHLPIGYHGRAGTVVVSGTDVVRPTVPTGPGAFGPTTRLDVEAEVGFVCGGPVRAAVNVDDAEEHLFGVVLVNDWSARDVQAWEARPLGPHLGKSFATSVSAWVTPLAAFDAARIAPPAPTVELTEHLVARDPWGLDLTLSVEWNTTVVSRPPYSLIHWTPAQQLAHLTVGGAPVRPGDLFASGTVSGPQRHHRGCFLELSWGGRDVVTLDDGSRRTFCEDGDTVTINATAPGPDGAVIGVAEVSGTVVAARTRP